MFINKEEVSQLKQVPEISIFENGSPIGVQTKIKKRGYFTSCETASFGLDYFDVTVLKSFTNIIGNLM